VVEKEGEGEKNGERTEEEEGRGDKTDSRRHYKVLPPEEEDGSVMSAKVSTTDKGNIGPAEAAGRKIQEDVANADLYKGTDLAETFSNLRIEEGGERSVQRPVSVPVKTEGVLVDRDPVGIRIRVAELERRVKEPLPKDDLVMEMKTLAGQLRVQLRNKYSLQERYVFCLLFFYLSLVLLFSCSFSLTPSPLSIFLYIPHSLPPSLPLLRGSMFSPLLWHTSDADLQLFARARGRGQLVSSEEQRILINFAKDNFLCGYISSSRWLKLDGSGERVPFDDLDLSTLTRGVSVLCVTGFYKTPVGT
jgi:hypothetical protein